MKHAKITSPSQWQLARLLALYQNGQLADAENLALKITQAYPKDQFSWKILGAVLKRSGRVNEALTPMQKSVQLAPQDAEAHINLGATLKELGRIAEAEVSYSKSIALKPDLVEAHYNLANMLRELGRLAEAEASYVRSIALKPNFAAAHSNLGNTLKDLGKLEEAEVSYKQAIALKLDFAEAHNNLGITLQELHRFDEAEASFVQAIKLKRDYIQAYDNLLFASNYNPQLSAVELYRRYQAYSSVISSLTERHFDHTNHRFVTDRRIRIGYSSPDFRDHACRFFMEPIFRHHDRNQFELFAYSNTKYPDEHTERMKNYFDHWVDVMQLSDDAMAQRIYDDKIDILIDMAGHTKGNRLLVLAMRPAPIQVASLIGYGYTTGLEVINYIIADENFAPVGSEAYFSEQVWRLPAPCIVYEPPRDITPDVGPSPALRNGFVTFGSLSRLIRLNDPLLLVWKEILDRVPGSRLRLDQKPFAVERTRNLFSQRLERLGISRERVELTYSQPHWISYNDIDITLDCWPHNSGTTTMESLWMGVPVLSKMDRPSVGCMGAAILNPLGLADWVVEDKATYVEKAVTYAQDLSALAEIRASLRHRLETSLLLAAEVFTTNLEDAYRQMIKTGADI